MAVEQGQKCFVVELADAVRETRSDSGGRFRESRRVPLITASTVSSDEATDFILQPATRIRDYDVVLTAPSLGVGVDISRAANSKLVDFVFGSSNHVEIDQKGIVDKRELAESYASTQALGVMLKITVVSSFSICGRGFDSD